MNCISCSENVHQVSLKLVKSARFKLAMNFNVSMKLVKERCLFASVRERVSHSSLSFRPVSVSRLTLVSKSHHSRLSSDQC